MKSSEKKCANPPNNPNKDAPDVEAPRTAILPWIEAVDSSILPRLFYGLEQSRNVSYSYELHLVFRADQDAIAIDEIEARRKTVGTVESGSDLISLEPGELERRKDLAAYKLNEWLGFVFCNLKFLHHCKLIIFLKRGKISGVKLVVDSPGNLAATP